MGDELEQIVQRMIDAGEDEESIAAVIREYQPKAAAPTPDAPSPVTPYVMGAVGLASKAPAILSKVNTAAATVGKLPTIGKRVIPGVLAYESLKDVKAGNYGKAAMEAAPSVPIAARAVASATGGIGPVAAGANWLSRLAGRAAGPLSLLSLGLDLGQISKYYEQRAMQEHPEILGTRDYSVGGF